MIGWAAAAAAADPPPVQLSVVSNETIDSHWVAVELTSAARLAYAAAAAMSGAAPGPMYTSVEVISGGIAAKSKTICLLAPFIRSNFASLNRARCLDGRRFRHDDRLDAVARRAEAGTVACGRVHFGHPGDDRLRAGLRRGGSPAHRL